MLKYRKRGEIHARSILHHRHSVHDSCHSQNPRRVDESGARVHAGERPPRRLPDLHYKRQCGIYNRAKRNFSFAERRCFVFKKRVEFELETSEKNVHNQKISDENGRFEPLFRRLIETDVQKKAGYDVKCMSVLYEIYYEMIRCKQERGAVSFRHPQIERICYDMQQKFKNPDYKVSGAARKAGISDVYFRRLFKEELGMSPLQYLISLRIAHAKNLITYEKKSVSEVASESGFSDIYYFSRMFKKATGFTPTEYRRYVNAY